MLLDGHVHLGTMQPDWPRFTDALAAAGVDGGIVLSVAPASFHFGPAPGTNAGRLDAVLRCRDASSRLHPFYWIDPLETDAIAQVAAAVAAGIAGFKTICDRYEPGHPRALAVFRAMAEANKPVLFHAGILWDGKPSSVYNRPALFEALLEVPRLRFALAHIAWPWCDECIAVYGKFRHALRERPDLACEMFIDTTPGTPPLYRREALTRLYGVGYEVERNVFFGSDGSVEHYDVATAGAWVARDEAILAEAGVTADARDRMRGGNLPRFLGASSGPLGGTPME